MKELIVDGVKYVPESPNGDRAIVVVDRGWIFAGDVTEKEGRIYLYRAVHVFSWQSGGFALLVSDPKKAGADLRPLSSPVDIPEGAEVFRVPVAQNWGM